MAIMGSGMATGENRAVEAATQAISSPLLENICIDGATGIIINVTGGPDLTLWEVNEASTLSPKPRIPTPKLFSALSLTNTWRQRQRDRHRHWLWHMAIKKCHEQINKLHAMTEAQLMNAGMSRLTQEINISYQAPQEAYAPTVPQTFENINLSEPLSPETPPPRGPAGSG